MEVKQLTDFSQLKRIYHSRMKKDFALNELRPLPLLAYVWKRGELDGYGLYEGNDLLAYALFARMAAGDQYDYLFDYYAISENRRGEGLGSFFLKELRKSIKNARYIIGEVEDPDYAKGEEDRLLRQRRLEFYKRNGFYETDIISRVFGVHYRLIGIPTESTINWDEYREVYRKIYRKLLPFGFHRFFFHIDN